MMRVMMAARFKGIWRGWRYGQKLVLRWKEGVVKAVVACSEPPIGRSVG